MWGDIKCRLPRFGDGLFARGCFVWFLIFLPTEESKPLISLRTDTPQPDWRWMAAYTPGIEEYRAQNETIGSAVADKVQTEKRSRTEKCPQG